MVGEDDRSSRDGKIREGSVPEFISDWKLLLEFFIKIRKEQAKLVIYGFDYQGRLWKEGSYDAISERERESKVQMHL